MKSRHGKSERREEEWGSKKRQSEERRSRCAKRSTVFFPLVRGSGGLNSRLAKAAGAERLKIARRCREKHMSKPKCAKHTTLGPLLEVDMSKKCTPLWREAHFQVKMYKAHHSQTTFGSWHVEKVHAVVARSTFQSQKCKNGRSRSTFGSSDVEKAHAVVARSTLRSQKCRKLRGTEHFWTFGCRFAWQAQGILHLVKSEQNVRVF